MHAERDFQHMSGPTEWCRLSGMTCSSENQLIDACMAGRVDAVRAIVASDPGAVNRKASFIDSTPLIFAAHRGHLAIVEILLDQGAEVDARETASDTTALHWAAEGGHPAIIDRLLRAGAAMDVLDAWYGLGPASWASFVVWAPRRHADRPAAFDRLVQHGADVDAFACIARDEASSLAALLARRPEEDERKLGDVMNGDRPLHAAARRSSTTCIDVLARGGAALDAPNALGESPLAVATPAAADRLLALGAPLDVSARLARGDLDGARAMLTGDAWKSTPLLCALAERGTADAVDLLLRAGADPNVTAPELLNELPSASTPLHRAAKRGALDVVSGLLSAGADVDARAPRTALTPLHRAAAAGHKHVVQLLLERGADPTVKDLQHQATPAGWAEYAGHADVVRILGAKRKG
jgi:ankyrin repeat protein